MNLQPAAELALAALVLAYALLGVAYGDVGDKLGKLLVLVSIWIFFAGRREIRRAATTWFLLGALAVPVISWGMALLMHPEWAEGSPKINRVAVWLLPMTVAYALGGSTRNTLTIWAFAVLGLFIAHLLGGGIGEIARGLAGDRVDFKLHNAQHASMYFGVAMLGLVSFLPRLLANHSRRWLVIAIWLPIAVFVAICIVVTQTRAIWLGLFFAFLLLAWLFTYPLRGRRFTLGLGLLVAALALVVLIAQSDVVKNRLENESQTISSAFNGQFANLPFDSPGIRLHTWIAALKWAQQRPLTGWGGNGRNLVMEQTAGYPDWLRASTHHLHNSYLDTLVNYGAIGLSLLLGLWGWLIRTAIVAHRKGLLPRDMLQFFLAFMLLWAVINCFESYVYFSSGIFTFGLIAGGVLSQIWLQYLQAGPISTELEPAASTSFQD